MEFVRRVPVYDIVRESSGRQFEPSYDTNVLSA